MLVLKLIMFCQFFVVLILCPPLWTVASSDVVKEFLNCTTSQQKIYSVKGTGISTEMGFGKTKFTLVHCIKIDVNISCNISSSCKSTLEVMENIAILISSLSDLSCQQFIELIFARRKKITLIIVQSQELSRDKIVSELGNFIGQPSTQIYMLMVNLKKIKKPYCCFFSI